MFKEFFNAILEQLQHQNLLEAVRKLGLTTRSNSERNPDRRQLWDRRLRLLIPPEKISLLNTYPYLLESAVNRLSDLGQYTGQQTLFNLVDRYLHPLLDLSSIETTKYQLLDFFKQVVFWENGSWHGLIHEDRYKAVEKLDTNAGFNDEWQAAAFLSSCGYLYPSSLLACQEWLRFSGNTTTDCIWFDWLGELQALNSDPYTVFEADFILNSFFESWLHSKFPYFRSIPVGCSDCPLNTKCQYHQSRLSSDDMQTVENLLRIGDTTEITSSTLIRYLAADRYAGTEYQTKLVNSFTESGKLYHAEAETEDERLLLFLNALKLFTEKHSMEKPSLSGTVFNKSDLIYQEIKSELQDLQQEAFYTLILDNRFRMIHLKQITKGTLNRSLIHPRELFAPAIQLRAAAVALVHNHPSGDPQPSTQDIEITKRLVEAGNIIGINVIDHVIIGNDSYFSFVDEELM